MNELHDREIRVLTIQVVMDTLENLVPIDRLITLAHYMDQFDDEYLSDILEMSREYITYELSIATKYIKSKCLEYECENNCTLMDIDERIIYEAFTELFKKDRYLINGK